MKITALSCSEYLLPDVMGLVLFGTRLRYFKEVQLLLQLF